MDGISRSCGWDKEILHGVSPMEQLVLSDKWARNYQDVLEPFCKSTIKFLLKSSLSLTGPYF